MEACPYVDAHAHIWTREVSRFPLAPGKTVDDLAPPSFTAEELLETARPAGVGRVVLIQHYPYHGYDNAYLVDAARRYPDAFAVVAMVDHTQAHPDTEMRRLREHNVTGFRIAIPRQNDGWLDIPGMPIMWQCAAETGQAICCHLAPSRLPSLETMCQRHPDTSVVIDHLALIGSGGGSHDSEVEALCRLARFPNVYVKVSAFYALGKKEPPYLDLVPIIRCLGDAFGAERLMWGSDAPYQLREPHTYAASIALIHEHLDFLSPNERLWLLSKTAEKVFFPG